MGQGQVKPVYAKVNAVMSFPNPTNKRETNALSEDGRVLQKVMQQFLTSGRTFNSFTLKGPGLCLG